MNQLHLIQTNHIWLRITTLTTAWNPKVSKPYSPPLKQFSKPWVEVIFNTLQTVTSRERSTAKWSLGQSFSCTFKLISWSLDSSTYHVLASQKAIWNKPGAMQWTIKEHHTAKHKYLLLSAATSGNKQAYSHTNKKKGTHAHTHTRTRWHMRKRENTRKNKLKTTIFGMRKTIQYVLNKNQCCHNCIAHFHSKVQGKSSASIHLTWWDTVLPLLNLFIKEFNGNRCIIGYLMSHAGDGDERCEFVSALPRKEKLCAQMLNCLTPELEIAYSSGLVDIGQLQMAMKFQRKHFQMQEAFSLIAKILWSRSDRSVALHDFRKPSGPFQPSCLECNAILTGVPKDEMEQLTPLHFKPLVAMLVKLHETKPFKYLQTSKRFQLHLSLWVAKSYFGRKHCFAPRQRCSLPCSIFGMWIWEICREHPLTSLDLLGALAANLSAFFHGCFALQVTQSVYQGQPRQQWPSSSLSKSQASFERRKCEKVRTVSKQNKFVAARVP